jgi:stage III sporulation protein SpoIIIAA
VTAEQLASITSQIKIGHDNRGGISGTLHRISVCRNREGDVIGMTMRVGRHVANSVEPLRDLFVSGPPHGAGALYPHPWSAQHR